MAASAFPGHAELFDSAKSFARTALEAQGVPDARRAALDAGTALEHLIKASLAKRSPVLLLELQEKNWGALLLLLGESKTVSRPLRSISLAVAVDRFRELGALRASKEDLMDLVELRNGVVHVAANEPIEERIVTAFLRQVDACIADYGATREAFWGERLEAVDALLAEHASRIERIVTHKLAMAKQRFEERFRDFAPDLVKAFVGSRDLPGENESHRTCPICAAIGVARGAHRIEADYYYDHRGDVDGGAWVEFEADSFACPACGLRLESPEEMSQGGMDTSWVDKDVDVSDLLEEDEDLWRER